VPGAQLLDNLCQILSASGNFSVSTLSHAPSIMASFPLLLSMGSFSWPKAVAVSSQPQVKIDGALFLIPSTIFLAQCLNNPRYTGVNHDQTRAST